MATDFLKILQEVRGTGAPEATPTDGIYWDLTISLTGDNNAAGKYGHILEMYNELNGPGGSYDDFIVKYNDFLIKHADVIVQQGLATDAAEAAELSKVAAEGFKNESEMYRNEAVQAAADVATRLDATQLNGKSVEDNLESVASNETDINNVANVSDDITVVSNSITSGDITAVVDNTTYIKNVSDNIVDVNITGDNIASVVTTAQHIAQVDIVSGVATEVGSLANEPAYTALLNAESNAFEARRDMWEAQANMLTADSYANEEPNVFVKMWSSVGDGTFRYINTNEYSSLHYSKITKGGHKFVGSFDASTVTSLPQDGSFGEYYEVSVAGDVNGTVTPQLEVGDELRWGYNATQWSIYRQTLSFFRLLYTPDNVIYAQDSREKAQPDGYAPLDSNALVPAVHLPSYVDDVIEVPTYADLPVTGEGNKIYVVVEDETSGGNTSTYRWTGTIYAMISDTMTAGDIKSLYESNSDTNEFDDSEKLLLDATTPLDTAATTLPSALNEVHGEVDAHVASTSAHGVATVAGLDDVQEFTNKTLTDPSNHIHAARVDLEAKNTSGSLIPAGSPVTFTEVNAGDNYEITLTDHDTMIAGAVTSMDIAEDAIGTVVLNGRCPLNTEDYHEGEILYVSNGTLSNIEPSSGYSQPIAMVLRDAVDGIVQVLAAYPKQDSDDVRYDNTSSGLTSIRVQGAIDELDVRVDTLEGDNTTNGSVDKKIKDQAQLADFTPIGNISSTTIAEAIAEVDSETDARLDTLEADVTTTGSVLKTIKDEAENATFTVGTTGLSATITGAITDLDTAIDNHMSDADGAHAASAISNAPSGDIASTDVQGAINELDTEKVALTKTNQTITGSLTVTGDVTISGDLTVVDTETVRTSDNIIEINYGEAGNGVTSGEAGISIDRGTATNYDFKFVELDGSFKIGEEGNLQKVATREDAPTDTGLALWNDATARFDTTLTPTVTTLHTTGAITTDSTVDGRDVAADGTKLDTIESGATADQTDLEIKTAYESNADTNAFTDSDKTKLQGIEDNAKDDQTAAEVAYSNAVSGLAATNVNDAVDEVEGRVDTLESDKAPLVSPTLTGTPTAPTAASGDASTTIATTAFVQGEIAEDTYSKAEIDTTNTFRADKYLAAQDMVAMFYDVNSNLSKIQYNNATDVEYETLQYTDGTLTSINHYTDSTLQGTTTLSYTNGELTSVVYTTEA